VTGEFIEKEPDAAQDMDVESEEKAKFQKSEGHFGILRRVDVVDKSS